MSAGWGPDPWGRFGFRWYTDLGWTEHVSDGTGRFVDPPGDRPTAAPPPPPPAFDPPPVVLMPPPPTAPSTAAPASPPSAPTATSLPPIASVRSARVAEPVATTTPAAAAASTARPANPTTTVRPTAERPPAAPATTAPHPPQHDRLRWVWVVAAMVVAFVLGAVVFGGDDDGDSAAETTVETTVVETVPPTVATTVPETVPPTPPPTTTPPDPEQVARNDRQIDDLEWGIITSSFAPAFGIEPPPRETAVTLGNQLCDIVASVSTPEELDLALVPVLVASGLPVGQAGLILGAFGALMCEDTLEALGIPVTY